jgi:hypothetical protein
MDTCTTCACGYPKHRNIVCATMSSMKRSGFIQRRTPLKSYSSFRTKPYHEYQKKQELNMPAWIRAIRPHRGHGNGAWEQRLWKLTTDYVRIRDWYKYNGRCVATGEYIPHWKNGTAGHFIRFSVCNGAFKYDPMNIHLQSFNSNLGIVDDIPDIEYQWGYSPEQETAEAFARELNRRYGRHYTQYLETQNRSMRNSRLGTPEVHKLIIEAFNRLAYLPEQPHYYQRILDLRNS